MWGILHSELSLFCCLRRFKNLFNLYSCIEACLKKIKYFSVLLKNVNI